MSAGEKSFQALDYVRGIWNLFLNYRRFRLRFGTSSPMNNLVVGVLQTVHIGNGRMVEDFWYENRHLGRISAYNLHTRYKELKEFELWVRRQVETSPLRHFLVTSIIRYVHALDETNPESSFLKLWSTLEDLTCTAQGRDRMKR
jgi:hypothetical protein